MSKIFYKKDRPVKMYFLPGLKHHSTAFGESVLREACLWREEFGKRWNHRNENVLLSECGEPGGNPVRWGSESDLTAVIPRARTGVLLRSSSVLPALWAGDLRLEADRTGKLIVNGEKTKQELGIELKAWAVGDLFERGAMRRLFVIGRGFSDAAPSLSVYEMDPAGKLTLLTRKPLAQTAEPKSHILCYGRHIFVVHDRKFLYFYDSPVSGSLEETPLGDGSPLGRVILPPVADVRGNVFWLADSGICFFRIGYPGGLFHKELPDTFKADRICCLDGTLFLIGKERNGPVTYICEAYPDGRSAVTSAPIRPEILFCKRGETVYYLSVAWKMGRSMAVSALWDGRTEREFARTEMETDARTYYFFGDVIADARYVGRNQNNEIIVMK